MSLIAGTTTMTVAGTLVLGAAGAAVCESRSGRLPAGVTVLALPDVPGTREAIAGVIPPLVTTPVPVRATGSATAVPIRAAAPGAAVAAARPGCREPACDVRFHGGPVQTRPAVYLLYWGPKWGQSRFRAAFTYVFRFFAGLGASPWSAIISQYGGKAGHPRFGSTQLRGVYLDTTAPPKRVGSAQLSGLVGRLAAKARLRGSDVQVVVAAQQGTCFSDGFAGSCGKPDQRGDYCAYHSAAHGIPFLNIPYQPDAGKLCGQSLVNRGAAGRYDAFSIAGGHEFSEAITDPLPGSPAWIDLGDSVSGG